MTVTVSNLPYNFCPNSSGASNQGFMFKNGYDGWFYANATATATQITDPNFPAYHTYNLTTLTSVTTVATATTSVTHGLSVNDPITITGATPAAYNGSYVVTGVPAGNQFTYTFAGGSSPATLLSGLIFGTTLTVPTGGLTSGGTTAIVNFGTTPHGLNIGDSVTISGASPVAYNGTYTVAAPLFSPTLFTYTFAGGTSPATGTILVKYSRASLTSLTSVTTVATGATLLPHGLTIGDSITISGTSPAAYNGTYTVTGTPTTTTFTYTFAGGTSPALISTTASGGKHTVPGIVYLDSAFYVMSDGAIIYGSNLNDATTWNALNFIGAQIEPGAGKALAKSQNYVIAFKEWSTEFFYDAANATGSPLSTVGNGFNLVGCANGDSVASLDGILFWVSQTRQKGRGVHMMRGLQEQQISTPDIERILNLSTLATIYSFGVKIAGHAFYVLTLVDLNITLVYDMTSQAWAQWSSLTVGTPVSVTSINLVGTTATVVTGAAHNLNDGDPVLIAGANQAAYNGIQVITYISATSYSFQTTAGTTSPATGTITSAPYTETYFKYTKYINALNKDLVQHETNGTLCELVETAYQDVGIPVNVLIRTGKLDMGTTNLKRYASLELIGNKVTGNAYVRSSGDDYTTFTQYRPVNLLATRSIIRRLGADRRRSYDIRYLGNTSLQLTAIDVEVV